jgi:hypothetical protein
MEREVGLSSANSCTAKMNALRTAEKKAIVVHNAYPYAGANRIRFKGSTAHAVSQVQTTP